MKNLWRWGLVTNSLLNSEWLKLLGHYKRLFVGFSGGLDSTVLLVNLAAEPALAPKLTAVHINHGLSPQALTWQNHCQLFCQERQIPFVFQKVEFERQANIEAAARKARYKVFESLLEVDDCLILGHHLDDQAETLLLQLFRGTGVDGLAAMVAVKDFAAGQLLRPLLQQSRQCLEVYAQTQQLQWIEDESNQNTAFSRNYLRHQVIPLVAKRWPAITTNLVRTAGHCQEAQANLDDLAKIDCPALDLNPSTLTIEPLLLLKPARLSNVLRLWFKVNQVSLPNAATFKRLVSEMILANCDANPQINWGECTVRRYQQTLYLLKKESKILSRQLAWPSFPDPLYLEGIGYLQVQPKRKGLVLPSSSQIEIRFRQGGEFFKWHGQTKQLKKLFQEWQIPPWLRERIPLLYINSELAAVIGYAVSDLYYQENTSEACQVLVAPVNKTQGFKI